MPIFNLNNVAKKRISSHWPHKIFFCLLISFHIFMILLQFLWSLNNRQRFILCIILFYNLRISCFTFSNLLLILYSLFLLLNLFKSVNEILSQSLEMRILFFKSCNWNSIRNSFNQSTCWTRRYNIKRFQPKFKFMRIKNCLKFTN